MIAVLPDLDDAVRRLLAGYAEVPGPDDPALAAIAAAIVVEDAFGIIIPDDDIDLSRLTDPEQVVAMIRRAELAGGS